MRSLFYYALGLQTAREVQPNKFEVKHAYQIEPITDNASRSNLE